MGKDNDFHVPKDPLIKVRIQSLIDFHVGQIVESNDLVNTVKPAW